MTPVWSVPTGDAGTDGSAEGGASARMGYVAGTTDDDQVSVTRCVCSERVESEEWTWWYGVVAREGILVTLCEPCHRKHEIPRAGRR